MTVSIGSGLGGQLVAVQQTTYGGAWSAASARTIGTFRSFKPTHKQNPVQGGAYLRVGELAELGAARLLTWLTASAALSGDLANTGQALFLASCFGSTGTLTQSGTTTAYQLGGASGINANVPPEQNSLFIDMQAGVPDAGAAATTPGTLHAFTYHSGLITKATWVFERDKIVTYEYEFDYQYVSTSESLAVASEPAEPVPFTMANNAGAVGATSQFKIGTLGAEANVSGIRKCTITLERPMRIDRIYMGQQYKLVPISNGKVKLGVQLDYDYDSDVKTALADLQIAGTPISIVADAVGNAIGSSGLNDRAKFNVTNAFVDAGGEPPLADADIVKNTASLSGTIDNSADPAFKLLLNTADTAW